MSRSQPQPRSQFKVFMPMQTRWSDNDVYGHINNVVYYSYFDTAVNQFLIEQGLLDIQHSQIIGLVVATQCEYFKSIAYPDALEIGIAVTRLGRSSVHYELGVFQQGHDTCCALGKFVHVYVDKSSLKPQPLNQQMTRALTRIKR